MRVCVDIGGTKVAVSLSPQSGAPLVGRRTEPTAKTGNNDAVALQILRMVDEACAEKGVDPKSIGCGIAGPARGLPNDWRTAQLEAPLKKRFARVRVENDGVAALEAERRWGALQGLDHCAYVTWSTGVGVGLCVDGRILRGKNGNAGHAGHSFVVDDGSGA